MCIWNQASLLHALHIYLQFSSVTVHIQFLREYNGQQCGFIGSIPTPSHFPDASKCKKMDPWKHVHQSYSLGSSMRFCCYILIPSAKRPTENVYSWNWPTWPNSINWQVCHNSLQIWEPRLSQLVQLLQSRVRSSIPRSSRIRSAWLVWKVLKWVPFASGRVELVVRYWIIHKDSPTYGCDAYISIKMVEQQKIAE